MSTHWQKLKPSDVASRDEIARLRAKSDLKGAGLLLHAWAVIGFAAALYAVFPGFWTGLAALLLVGGRQLGLAILMHDGSHGLLFRTRALNEHLTRWLAAAPMLIDMDAYRIHHMQHHRFTRTEKDPDEGLYAPFPVGRASMARKLLRDITGLTFLRVRFGELMHHWRHQGPGEPAGRAARMLRFYGPGLLVNALMAGAAMAAGRGDVYLVVWLLPFVTSYNLFLRVRNMAEHATVPDLGDPLRNSRTTLAGPVERALVAPYFVNFHIEHHLMPFVPCYHLPRLHRLMRERGYHDQMEIRPGYGDIIRLNAGRPEAA
ncbi:fatty acid desaturase family protein [Yunchengibacter salinarum]|uniref:fatty acid desaturase family protein n=1 Tax=Yunchengibacter salinarum TaxID=3133399 RepID=UPI0035B63C29